MNSSNPVGVGVIGAGKISDQYLTQLTSYPDLRVHIVSDAIAERAAAQATKYHVMQSGSVEDALTHPDVEIIVNLTIPASHSEISRAALIAGKHVWTEKPFALDRETGRALVDLAREKGLRIGCAPDTFLGAGLQTARRMIERGDIGVPQSALTLFETPGPGPQHHNLEVLLSKGAGPLFDMGPYYFTALVQTFGSVESVVATARTARPRRDWEREGREVVANVPTNVSVLSLFEGGQMGTSIFSWDSPIRRDGWVEVTGTEATIAVPDPNRFDGDVRLKRFGEDEWITVPSSGAASGRGVGTLEIARAVRDRRPHRASPELAYHVLDVLISATESLDSGSLVDVNSSASPAEILPEDWDPHSVTLR